MKAHLLCILTTLVSIVACGCGGGTIGTGLGNRGAEFAGFGGGHHGPLSFMLNATVANGAGRVVPKATLRVTSSVNTYSCVTAANGTCALDLRMMAGEPIALVIMTNGAKYASQEYLSPAGQSNISRTFILRADHSIETQEP